MRRAYLLILIASALLLSGPEQSSKPTELSSPKVSAGQGHQSSNSREQETQPKHPPETTESTQKNRTNVTAENRSDTIKVILPPVTIQKDWADYGLFFFSGLLVLVTSFQLRLLKRALISDRPLLWVRRVEIGHDPPNPGLPAEFGDVVNYASCVVQNLGKRGAIISEVVARLKFAYPVLPLAPTFKDCLKVPVLQPMVTENEPTNFIVRLSTPFTHQEIAKMTDPEAHERFFCYGIIRYKDPSGASYTTTFGFHCQRLTDDGVHFQLQFVPDHRGYNRST
jgi:hypothetical protein